ncbi:amino acid ABC transporter permease [Desulfobulbus oligotrophicus]|jgi:polar amino acid transport system permease protein|uniref:Putative glutamine transport system permease protein GlnP n=1 Tax=Desulfobulbus oligotrophicus TaxID=1909699 RepID=A0A7T5VC04_9BACT|nr:amino acid ABC transporter permease [Desulfobulbus oligotrophicus]MDY0390289.1 amino acid ABC transporter permease [Desulfobulbus oligotrophicus]QQG65112.1 amino acid ABC transporter permease [Desulfobulbus oligotrophicus]
MSEPERTTIEIGDGAAIPRAEDRGLVSAWWLALIGAATLLVVLPWIKPDPYLTILRFVPDGVVITFKVTVLSISLAIFIGLVTGLGRISRNRFINLIASLYVEVVRGIPLLVQLFYIYYALGRLVRVPDLVAAVIAMAFCYGAYMGEVFRAGIQSIDYGQSEAAQSLGFNPRQTMTYVVLPQAWRTILPPVGNEFIALLKDTSLVSILAVSDILRRGREYASESFNYFETYTMIALIYLVITLILSKLISLMEYRLSYYDRR